MGRKLPARSRRRRGPGEESSSLVGRIYAANTGGAILGALAFSLFIVPWIGTQGAEKVLICLAALGALVVLGPLVLNSKTTFGMVGVVAAMGVALFVALEIPAVPPELIAYGRRIMINIGPLQDPLHRGRHQFIDRHLALGRWRYSIPRQRQGGSVHRVV